MSITNWLRENKVFQKLFISVLVFLFGMAFGAYSKKSTVVEKEKIIEKQVTTEAYQELMKKFEDLRVELERVRETQVVEKYHREELETRLADGTYTKKVTVDKNIESHTKETETKVELRVVEVEKKIETVKIETVEKEVIKEKLIDYRSNWDISVKVGGLFTEIPNAIEKGTWNSPIVIGVEVDRRIAGPLKLGLWANSNLAFNNVSGGLSVGLDF